MSEANMVVIGNVTAPVELRYTQSGKAVANFTVASTPRHFDRKTNEWVDGTTTFIKAVVWDRFAENIAGSLEKGSRVVVTGALRQRSYQDREGQSRTSFELDVDDLGASLKHATASLTRVSSVAAAAQQAADATDSWGSFQSDETPF